MFHEELFRGLWSDDRRFRSVRTLYTFDQMSRLQSMLHRTSSGSTTLGAYDFEYSTANWLTTLTTSADGSSTYEYDDNGQLTSADHSSQSDEAYSYDANGNRTNAGYSTASDNRLTTDGTFTYEYDKEGNRTKRTGNGAITEYSYDHHNRLREVITKTSGGTITKKVQYVYDAMGNRLAKRIDTNGDNTFDQTERFGYDDGGKLSHAFSETGTIQSRFLQGPAADSPIAEVNATSNTVTWMLVDHQGTVRDTVDSTSSGTLSSVRHVVFDAFGNVTGSNSVLRFGYTGQEQDLETGLLYMNTRYYDPKVGRFLSQDTIGYQAGDSNLYRYVGNGTMSRQDPQGQSWLSEFFNDVEDVWEGFEKGWKQMWKQVGRGLTHLGTELTESVGAFSLDLGLVRVGWSEGGFSFGVGIPVGPFLMGPDIAIHRKADGGIDVDGGFTISTPVGGIFGANVSYGGSGFSFGGRIGPVSGSMGYDDGEWNFGAGLQFGSLLPKGSDGAGWWNLLTVTGGYGTADDSYSIGGGLSYNGAGVTESFTNRKGNWSNSTSITYDLSTAGASKDENGNTVYANNLAGKIGRFAAQLGNAIGDPIAIAGTALARALHTGQSSDSSASSNNVASGLETEEQFWNRTFLLAHMMNGYPGLSLDSQPERYFVTEPNGDGSLSEAAPDQKFSDGMSSLEQLKAALNGKPLDLSNYRIITMNDGSDVLYVANKAYQAIKIVEHRGNLYFNRFRGAGFEYIPSEGEAADAFVKQAAQKFGVDLIPNVQTNDSGRSYTYTVPGEEIPWATTSIGRHDRAIDWKPNPIEHVIPGWNLWAGAKGVVASWNESDIDATIWGGLNLTAGLITEGPAIARGLASTWRWGRSFGKSGIGLDPADFSGHRNYDYPISSSDIGSTGLVRSKTPWQRSVIERPGMIDWDLIRPDGVEYSGLTNLYAAKRGWAPVRLNPESGRYEVAVLHHLLDDPRGAVMHTWLSPHSSYHGMIGRSANDFNEFVGQAGSWRTIRPDWAGAWDEERAMYWQWRTGARTYPTQQKLWLPGDSK